MKSPETIFRQLSASAAQRLDKVTKGKLTPDSLTLAGLILHLPVAWLIAVGALVPAAAGLLLAASLDGLDGALARLQNRTSAFGTWLDATADRLKEIIVFVGLIYYLAANEYSPIVIAMAGLALGLSVLVSYAKAKGEAVLAAGRRFKVDRLNRVLGAGIMSYGVRTIITAGMLAGHQFVTGLSFLLLGNAVTLVQRTAKVKSSLKQAEKTKRR